MNIAEIDRNFALPDALKQPDLVWHDVKAAPIDLYGLDDPRNPDLPFHRIPFDVAERTSEKVIELHLRTAGGRARFTTDSPYIALLCQTEKPIGFMAHMTLAGSQGFDLYENLPNGETVFVKPIIPPTDSLGKTDFSGIIQLGEGKSRSFTLNFPPYGTVKNLWIGLKEGSSLSGGVPYRNELPAVFYGSSITAGGCASRPGLTYQSLLSKYLNLHYLNLGFSGAARGETAIVEYMAGLKMSCFVSDYDHNAPNIEHLMATLPPLYRAVRDKNPTLPFVFMSAPGEKTPSWRARRDFIEETYRKAIAEGDKNVYFVDGWTMFTGDLWDECTVEWCHPNDLGFRKMMMSLLPLFQKLYPGE